ncbi:MAG TPA: hypothetical protein VKB78_11840, partial [Pirellulales bacterium]|nr:hypothetical protein [Pirellulales bacterium]
LLTLVLSFMTSGCDTSPKPTVTPQPEIVQPDANKQPTKNNGNKPAVAKVGDKDEPGNESAGNSPSSKQTSNKDAPTKETPRE